MLQSINSLKKNDVATISDLQLARSKIFLLKIVLFASVILGLF